ncbi:MAG: chemotaxis protein CheW [Wolinella sp.]
MSRMEEVFKQQQQSKQPTTEAESVVQLVGFIVGTEEFAVPILSIQEIIKPLEYTRVPGTPNYVLGVFNLRGNVIPLINLRLKFGLPADKQNDDTRYIVIKHNDEVAGFVIDRLTEAVRIKESSIDPTPETISEEDNIIYGIGKKEDRLITILKTEGLLKRTF